MGRNAAILTSANAERRALRDRFTKLVISEQLPLYGEHSAAKLARACALAHVC